PLVLLFSAPRTPPPDRPRLSLPDALPISVSASVIAISIEFHIVAQMIRVTALADLGARACHQFVLVDRPQQIVVDADVETAQQRSEEHTSELQSRFDLVCRLLLEQKIVYY